MRAVAEAVGERGATPAREDQPAAWTPALTSGGAASTTRLRPATLTKVPAENAAIKSHAYRRDSQIRKLAKIVPLLGIVVAPARARHVQAVAVGKTRMRLDVNEPLVVSKFE